jgi:hypothetical protein
VPSDTRAGRILRPLAAGGLLGALGLLAGYFWPLWLNPYSNLGPLIGIDFTGPLALAVGLASGLTLGVVAHVFAWRRSRFSVSLGLAGVAPLAFTFFLALPDDRWEADLIEGQIVAYTHPSSFEPQVVRYWESSIAINPQNPVTPSWRKDLRAVLAGSADCVADIRIRSKRALYFGRQPWNRGKLYFVQVPLPPNPERFFLPARFCAPASQTSRRFLARSPDYAGFPPNTAASLLNLQQLEPVPPQISFLAAESR